MAKEKIYAERRRGYERLANLAVGICATISSLLLTTLMAIISYMILSQYNFYVIFFAQVPVFRLLMAYLACFICIFVVFWCNLTIDQDGVVKNFHEYLLFCWYPMTHRKILISGSQLWDEFKQGPFAWCSCKGELELKFCELVDPRMYSFRNCGDLILLQFKDEQTGLRLLNKRFSFKVLNDEQLAFLENSDSLVCQECPKFLKCAKDIEYPFDDKEKCELVGITYNYCVVQDIKRASPHDGETIVYTANDLNKYVHFPFHKIKVITDNSSDDGKDDSTDDGKDDSRDNTDRRGCIAILGDFSESVDYYDAHNPDAYCPPLNSFCGWILDICKLLTYVLCCFGKNYEKYDNYSLCCSFYNVIWKYGNKRYLVKLNSIEGMTGSPVSVAATSLTKISNVDAICNDEDEEDEIETGKGKGKGTGKATQDNEAACLGMIAAARNSENDCFSKSSVLQPVQYATKLIQYRSVTTRKID